MRLLIITVLTLFLGIAANAQSGVANLTITLSDVQTVRIPLSVDASIQSDQDNQVVEMLSPSTSQIKIYSSLNSDIEKLNKDFYSGNQKNSSITTYASNHPKYAKGNSRVGHKVQNVSPQLLVYQIDPR